MLNLLPLMDLKKCDVIYIFFITMWLIHLVPICVKTNGVSASRTGMNTLRNVGDVFYHLCI